MSDNTGYQQRSRERAEALERVQERYKAAFEAATRFTTVHRGLLGGADYRAAIVKDSKGPRYHTIEVVFFEPEGLGHWRKATARRAHGGGYWSHITSGPYYIQGLPGEWQPPGAEHRDILGVPAGATQEEVKRAWQRFAQTHHPDRGGDPEMFKRGRQAYESLMG